jgi:hypothetical protein
VKFVSNRDVVIRSAAVGQAIRFIKGEPTVVPKAMWAEVQEKGILPVEDSGEPVKPGEAQTVPVAPKIVLPPEGQERIDRIVEAFKAIVERNNSADFTGGSTPAASAVTAAVRFKVDQKEVRSLWEKHRASLLGTPQL